MSNFVVIPAGSFLMGSPYNEKGRWDNENPQHEVRLEHSFAMSKYVVTFAEYDAFCDATGCEKPGDEGWGRDNRPAVNVSWFDAVAYCEWLSALHGETYRLPTETEWEYACRAGTDTRWSFGDDEVVFGDYAWYEENAESRPHPVGEKLPNPWGLYDMHGNVFEWCQDSNLNQKNRVVRGGSWSLNRDDARCAARGRVRPDYRHFILGFRIIREL